MSSTIQIGSLTTTEREGLSMTDSKTLIDSEASADPAITTSSASKARPRVWRAGAVAAIVGAAVAAAYGALLDVGGIPMLAGGPGASEATTISLRNFVEGTVTLTALATVLAFIFVRRARRPRHALVVATASLTLFSLTIPLSAGATALSTKLTLALGHLVVATVVIPIIARGLPSSSGGRGD
jgi:Family of unknown function (DUF6069)